MIDLHGRRWTVREADERKIALIGFRKLGEAATDGEGLGDDDAEG